MASRGMRRADCVRHLPYSDEDTLERIHEQVPESASAVKTGSTLSALPMRWRR